MSRWLIWGVALLLVAVLTAGSTAQDKKDADKKDAAKKDADKKDADKKDADKKDADKKDADKKDADKKDADKKDAAKKDGDKKPDDKKPMDKRKTTSIAGELVHIEPSKQSIRVKVTIPYQELNQGEYNALIQAQQNLAKARTPKEAYDARVAIAQHSAKLYTVKQKHQEYTIDATDDCKVRLNAPKAAFDDMGNVKKYTAKELKELRGSDMMFDGEFADLTNGQIVQVTILVPKAAPKPKNKDDILLEENKLEAIRIAVLRQPAPR
jgi:pentapeptide MXKDX repeat protein